MALIKTDYLSGAGVPVAYWKIIDYRVNTYAKTVDISFGGWLNADCRAENLELVENPKKVRCLSDKFDLYFSTEIIDGIEINMVSQMYLFAKENSEFFKDSTDLM